MATAIANEEIVVPVKEEPVAIDLDSFEAPEAFLERFMAAEETEGVLDIMAEHYRSLIGPDGLVTLWGIAYGVAYKGLPNDCTWYPNINRFAASGFAHGCHGFLGGLGSEWLVDIPHAYGLSHEDIELVSGFIHWLKHDSVFANVFCLKSGYGEPDVINMSVPSNIVMFALQLQRLFTDRRNLIPYFRHMVEKGAPYEKAVFVAASVATSLKSTDTVNNVENLFSRGDGHCPFAFYEMTIDDVDRWLRQEICVSPSSLNPPFNISGQYRGSSKLFNRWLENNFDNRYQGYENFSGPKFLEKDVPILSEVEELFLEKKVVEVGFGNKVSMPVLRDGAKIGLVDFIDERLEELLK